MTVKEKLHELVDQLDEGAAREALAYLQDLRLPRGVREAPIDDEPLSDEERAAIAAAHQQLVAGRVISDEEIRREFGAS
jgi:hypothetical protein